MVVVELGSLSCVVSRSSDMLIVGRDVAGMGEWRNADLIGVSCTRQTNDGAHH